MTNLYSHDIRKGTKEKEQKGTKQKKVKSTTSAIIIVPMIKGAGRGECGGGRERKVRHHFLPSQTFQIQKYK